MRDAIHPRYYTGIIAKYRKWILALTGVAVVLAALVSESASPRSYEASSTLALNQAALTGDEDLRDLSAALGDPAVLGGMTKHWRLQEQIITRLGDALPVELRSVAALDRLCAVVVDSERGTVTVSVRHSDRQVATEIANTWATLLVEQVQKRSKLADESVIDVTSRVRTLERPAWSQVFRDMAAAAVLALTLGTCGAIIAAFVGRQAAAEPRARTTLWSRGQSLTDQPLLGYAVLVLAILVAAFLRLRRLGDGSLWVDEFIVIRWAYNPPSRLAELLREFDTHPPLLHVLTRLALHLGTSEWNLRFPTALVGVMTIPLLYALGKRMFGSVVGLAAPLLLAVSPFHIHHSREVRPYAFLMLFSLLSLYALWRAMAENRRRWWGLFAVATVLNLYTHYFALLVTGGVILFALLVLGHDWLGHHKRGALPALRSMAVCCLVVAFAYLPWLPTMWENLFYEGRILTVPTEVSLESVQGSLVGHFVRRFGGGIDRPAAVTACAAILGLLVLLLRSRWQVVTLILCWVVPTMGAIRLWGLGEFFWRYPRLASYLQPLYIAFAAVGIEGLAEGVARVTRPRFGSRLYAAAVALGVLVLGVTSASAIGQYAGWIRPDWKGATEYLHTVADPGDIVIVDGAEYGTAYDSSTASGMISNYTRFHYGNTKGFLIWRETDVAVKIQPLANEQRGTRGIIYVRGAEDWQPDPEFKVSVMPFHRVLVLTLENPHLQSVDNAVDMLEAMARVLAPADPTATFDLHLALAGIYEQTGHPDQQERHIKLALAKMPAGFDARGITESPEYRDLALDSERFHVGPPNNLPTDSVLDPTSGSTVAGVKTYFTASWRDADGYQDLKWCILSFGSTPEILDGVSLLYDARQNRLLIRSDEGAEWQGGCAPGESGVLENGQCKVYCDETTVWQAKEWVGATWAIEFKPAFVGTHDIHMKCYDLKDARSPYRKRGTFTVQWLP